ncbi:hypothetical protein BDF14DRAFT_1807842 [Spinellus fusiger]|nr:hypothetical protein BDF14DRAFT_1807842 [Spinellus fusiger]
MDIDITKPQCNRLLIIIFLIVYDIAALPATMGPGKKGRTLKNPEPTSIGATYLYLPHIIATMQSIYHNLYNA